MSLRVRTQKIPAWPAAYDPADDDENAVRIEELRSSVAMILQVDDIWKTLCGPPHGAMVKQQVGRFGNTMNQVLRDYFIVVACRLFDDSRDSVSLPGAAAYVRRNHQALRSRWGFPEAVTSELAGVMTEARPHADKLRLPRNRFIGHSNACAVLGSARFPIGNREEHQAFLQKTARAVELVGRCVADERRPAYQVVKEDGDVHTLIRALAVAQHHTGASGA